MRTFAAVSAALGMLALAAPAGAASAPKRARAEALSALAACRTEADAAQRLACYDKAAGALDEAESHGQIAVVDREQVRAVKRQAFGFSLPSLALLGGGKVGVDDPVDRLTAKLDHANRTAEGRWIMATDEGAAWEQTDGEEIVSPPHAGSQLAVRKGALGGFFCNVDGQRAVRCTRRR